MTMIEADPYRNNRLRMTGYAKSSLVEVRAGFWMRVDGPNQELLGFDNMHDRPIIGTTEWTKSQIVLNVPAESRGDAGAHRAGSGPERSRPV